ncbi:MAG: tyrosine-type recombinase/integrase, partial [Vicinamibacteria bacterium]
MERAQLVLPRLFEQLRRQGVRDVLSVRELHLIRFARHLAEVPKKHGPQGATLSAGTRTCYLHTVRGFFAWLLRSNVLLENPAHDLPVPESVRLPRRVLTKAEARRLMNAPSRSSVQGQRDRAILEVLYGTGLRRGECLRLDVTDVDLGQELLLVRSGKGKKDRMVPLTRQAVSALDLYLREGRLELVKD